MERGPESTPLGALGLSLIRRPGEAVTGPPSGIRAYNMPNSIRPVFRHCLFLFLPDRPRLVSLWQ